LFNQELHFFHASWHHRFLLRFEASAKAIFSTGFISIVSCLLEAIENIINRLLW
jgi:hypothetical protein